LEFEYGKVAMTKVAPLIETYLSVFVLKKFEPEKVNFEAK
jgi:hypothetical protein